MDWPAVYKAVAHLHANSTPFMSVAFPVAVFRDLGLRFDETLDTQEDWHLTTRAAMICGVGATPEVTSVYRWWIDGESSIVCPTPKEWTDNRAAIIRSHNQGPVLLPAGAVDQIIAQIDNGHFWARERETLNAQLAHERAVLAETQALIEVVEQAAQGRVGRPASPDSSRARCRRRGEARRTGPSQGTDGRTRESPNLRLGPRVQLATAEAAQEESAARSEAFASQLLAADLPVDWPEANEHLHALSHHRLAALLGSTSWRSTRPLRQAIRVMRGRKEMDLAPERIHSSLKANSALIQRVRRSSSWRITAPVRFSLSMF